MTVRIARASGWGMGGSPVRFVATVNARLIELVVPKALWLRALKDSGQQPEESAIVLAPGRAYRLIEAEATQQVHLGNKPIGSVLHLANPVLD
jgi:hypothetical protein